MNTSLALAGIDAWLATSVNLFAECTVVTVAALVIGFTFRSNAAVRDHTFSAAVLCILLCTLLTMALPPLVPLRAVNWPTIVTEDVRVNAVTPDDVTIADYSPGISQTPTPALTQQIVPQMVLGTWSFGIVIGLLGIVRRLWSIGRIIRKAKPLPDSFRRKLIDEDVALLDQEVAQLVTSDDVRVPVAVGILTRVIIIPTDLLVQLEPGPLKSVLVHETAHLARRDPLFLLLQQLVAALFWPHPLVHVLNRKLCRVREELCDNYVLRRFVPEDYAETIVQVARLALSFGEPITTNSAALLTESWKLEERVTGLLDARRASVTSISIPASATIAASFLAIAFLVSQTEFARAQNPDPKSKSVDNRNRQVGDRPSQPPALPNAEPTRSDVAPKAIPTVPSDVTFTVAYSVEDLVRLTPPNPEVRDFESLISEMKRSISPDNWEPKGPAQIAVFPTNHCIVVSQTREAHKQLAAYLQTLRPHTSAQSKGLTLHIEFWAFDLTGNRDLWQEVQSHPDDGTPDLFQRLKSGAVRQKCLRVSAFLDSGQLIDAKQESGESHVSARIAGIRCDGSTYSFGADLDGLLRENSVAPLYSQLHREFRIRPGQSIVFGRGTIELLDQQGKPQQEDAFLWRVTVTMTAQT